MKMPAEMFSASRAYPQLTTPQKGLDVFLLLIFEHEYCCRMLDLLHCFYEVDYVECREKAKEKELCPGNNKKKKKFTKVYKMVGMFRSVSVLIG